MPQKTKWADLSAKKRMELLVTKPATELAREYTREGLSEDEFRAELQTEVELWDTNNIRDVWEVDKVPTKDVVLGAWRDLDRAEAIMELIDNSVDAWNIRRKVHPKKAAKTLAILIRIDERNGRLEYEDNAGGVPVGKLPNLVVPGYSDTDDLARTIGSYKTGGKKAIFRLAYAARIITRYWDPSEQRDEAIAVQLDQAWIEDSQVYKFPYVHLKESGGIPKGSTRYVLQLRKEQVDEDPWYKMPALLGKITKQITNAYTLLLIRNPNIKLSFGKKRILPNPDLYDFSGTKSADSDIRPQQVIFRTSLEYKGKRQALEIEVVLGCRVTTGVKDGKTGGIDLYGNDRLFVSHDQEIFSNLLPTGNSRNLVRGFVNIKGPNIFIPWDTHKRHLNEDREIVRRLTRSRLIMSVFENWKHAYRAISRLGTGEVTKFIETLLEPVFDKRKKDLSIPHRNIVELDFDVVRGANLPGSVHVPRVALSTPGQHQYKITLVLTTVEAREVMTYYKKIGEPTQAAMRDLSDLIKEEVLEWAEGVKHE